MDDRHKEASAEPGTPGAADARSGISTEDSERTERYLAGDRDTYAELDQWIRMELRRCYSRLSGELDDLCQIAHEKLFVELRAGRFEGRSTLRSYLGTIVHRTALDRLRLLYRDRALTESLSSDSTSGSTNPYLQIMVRDDVRLAHRVVMGASEACRELWRLIFAEKLIYEEVARRLEIPPGTVKSRMWHCRNNARKALRRLRMLERTATRAKM